MGVAERARGAEPEDELRKIVLAIGSVITEIDQQLIHLLFDAIRNSWH
jgi:hypothetical protein